MPAAAPCYPPVRQERWVIRNLAVLIPYLKEQRRPIAWGFACLLLAIGFSRLVPWCLKLAIDSLAVEQAGPATLAWAGVMAGCALAGGLFLYLQRWLIIGASREVEYRLRTDLFEHVQGLDLAFFRGQRAGDLMARFTNDLGAVRDVAGPGLMYAGQMSVSLAASISLMLALDPLLTLAAFLPYPLISWITYLYARSAYRLSLRVQELFGELSSRVQEDLAGVRVLRVHGREQSSAAAFDLLGRNYLEANLAVARLRARFLSALSALAGSGLAIALLVGGNGVIRGELSLGALVAFTAYLAELTWPVIAVGWVLGLIQRGAGAMARLQELLAARPAIASGSHGTIEAPRLEFDRVSFRYPGSEQYALEQVSFTLEPGQVLGVVGRTGSGKSTLLGLIVRFYDPTAGRILLDGREIRELDLGCLRAQLGYAPQEGFLFSRTIAENLAYGRPDAARPELELAARRAGLGADLAAFPDGLETRVGERGITLSGGQRQRLSLARALLLDPRLLLLDDTLSSVDAETEERILAELRAYLPGRTAIIVSHRVSAVRAATSILVLDRGRVAEMGSHAELLAAGGLYARLHERQRLAARLEEPL